VSDFDNFVNGYYKRINFDTMISEARQIANLQPTIKSSLIECRYYFKVTTDYDTFCCSYDPPTVYFPIIIYPSNIVTCGDIIKSINWNPITLSEFSISSMINMSSVQLTTPKVNNSVHLNTTSNFKTTIKSVKADKKGKHNKTDIDNVFAQILSSELINNLKNNIE
jgi:hypothetical protein